MPQIVSSEIGTLGKMGHAALLLDHLVLIGQERKQICMPSIYGRQGGDMAPCWRSGATAEILMLWALREALVEIVVVLFLMLQITLVGPWAPV